MKRWSSLTAIVLATVFFTILGYKENKTLYQAVLLESRSYMENIVIEQKKDGQEKWSAQIGRATLMDNRKDVLIEDVVFTSKEKGIRVKAKSGVYDIKKNNVTITGDMTAYRGDVEIQSKGMSFDLATETIQSDKEVIISSDKITARADSVEALKDERIRLSGNVTVVFK